MHETDLSASNLNTNILSHTTNYSENLKVLSDLRETNSYSLERSSHYLHASAPTFRAYELNEKSQTSSDFIQQAQETASNNYGTSGSLTNSNYPHYAAQLGEQELRVRDTTNFKSTSSSMYPK